MTYAKSCNAVSGHAVAGHVEAGSVAAGHARSHASPAGVSVPGYIPSSAKYLIFNSAIMSDDFVIFPAWQSHKEVAARLGVSPHAAGFIARAPDGGVICHGWSDSLGIHSRGEVDAEFINLALK